MVMPEKDYNIRKSIYCVSPNVVVKAVDDELVLVPVVGALADMSTLFRINETGRFIWELLNGVNDVETIALALEKEFEVSFEQALEDVGVFIGQMEDLVIEVN